MVIGTLIWAAGISLAWILLFAVLLLIFNQKDWTKDFKSAERVANLVTDTVKRPSLAQKAVAVFLHNFCAGVIVYALAASLKILLPASVIGALIPFLVALAYTLLNTGAVAFIIANIHQAKPKALGLLLAVALPHGIIELPANWLIIGHSLWIATAESFDPFGSLAIAGAWVALLLVAAVVETYITPKAVDWALAKLRNE